MLRQDSYDSSTLHIFQYLAFSHLYEKWENILEENKQLLDNDTSNKHCELTKDFYNLVNSLWKEPTYNKQYFTPTGEFVLELIAK